VGQKIMAAAVNVPVSVMENAGEGGAWGIALLGAYMANRVDGETLDDFLNNKVFAGQKTLRIEPNPADVAGFNAFMARYTNGLAIERAAVEHLK
jgi:sugar (pentulose or hexulose) kinase